MTDIAELARQVRLEATDVLNRHQKLASLNLYRILARCMELAEACRASIDAQQELRRLVSAEARGNRSYVEKDSDEFTLASRYVFSADSHSNICRYAHAMREAKKLQLTHKTLFDYLKNKGGVNALYLLRPTTYQTATAKSLRLDRSITIPKSGSFCLKLERKSDGSFQVLDDPDAG